LFFTYKIKKLKNKMATRIEGRMTGWKKVALIASILASLTMVARGAFDCGIQYMSLPKAPAEVEYMPRVITVGYHGEAEKTSEFKGGELYFNPEKPFQDEIDTSRSLYNIVQGGKATIDAFKFPYKLLTGEESIDEKAQSQNPQLKTPTTPKTMLEDRIQPWYKKNQPSDNGSNKNYEDTLQEILRDNKAETYVI